MNKIIKTKDTICTGCNRCVRECPMEMANITYRDFDGNVKVKVNHEKCINCGRCISVCKHDARHYEDDCWRFFDDLANGAPISIIAAPAIRTNFPEYKRLFTYLKQNGVKKIYDVSMGADICIWAHIRYIEKTEALPLITQPCPAIVRYCEIYQHDLLKNLSPVHSPMSCVSVYMKKYEGLTDHIAALSPCIAKSNEFDDTELAQYNVTFVKMLKHLADNNITLPEEETGFDHVESGLGALFPMPGGLKENIEFFLGDKFSIDRSEGLDVYKWLETYAKSPADMLPNIYDVLNCIDGCNMGSANTSAKNVFEINRKMDENRKAATEKRDKEYYNSLFQQYDERFDLADFLREYRKIYTYFPQISDDDVEKAFTLLGKNEYEERHIDCGACGNNTCYDMARKIALEVNIPDNCIFKAMADAHKEHMENLAVREQVALIEQIYQADERMRSILEANPQVNILFNSKFEIVECNPAAIDFMGFETKEDFFAGFMERVTKSIPAKQPDGRDSVPLTERFMTTIKDGQVRFETELVMNGDTRNLDIVFKKIPYEDSFGIVAYVFNMTEIHRREMELRRSRELNELQLTKLDLVVKATKIGL